MTNALSRVPSGGGTNRTLCNIEETDDIVRQLNSDDTVRHLNSDDTVRQLNSGNLESLAASVKEDFSRQNRNGGLDLVPAAQVDFFYWPRFFFIGQIFYWPDFLLARWT